MKNEFISYNEINFLCKDNKIMPITTLVIAFIMNLLD